MANQSQKSKSKIIMGAVLIGFSLILFALSVIPNFAVTSVALGVFGIVWYGLLAFMLLVGLAVSSGLKFMFSAKFATYLVLAIFSLLALLHTIFSTPVLAEMQGFENFKNYLESCFSLANGITVGGAFFGVFVYFFRAVFGMVGVYSVYVMLSAIFVGVVLDMIIYGKTKKAVIKTNQQNVQDVVADSDTAKETTFEPETYEQIEEEETQTEPSETEIAKRTIFQTFEEDKYISPNSAEHDPIISREQARNTLFGHREVPDITLENDKQRDAFMKNYRENEQVDDNEETDDISDLFGGGTIGGISQEQSEAYRRNFVEDRQSTLRRAQFDEPQEEPDEPLINFNDEKEENDFEIKPISSRGFGRETFDRRGAGRAEIEHARIDDEPKLGANYADNAKAQNINFDLTQKPTIEKPKPLRQDGQMGMRSVRYNPIPISNFIEYAETHEDHSEEYNRKSAALEQVMNEFGIGAKVIGVVRGPKVTRYEMSLPAGIATTKVTSIQNNIAMALMSKAPIRIEAPIPGKNAIGVELENDKPTTVGMRELLESPEFNKFKDPLPIAIGKDINGAVVIKSLPKMVHMLVAGSTGSGKSIFIHAIMMSILFKYSPEDVRFIMIDPKRVEFTMYNKLPHLILPDVLCDHDKALNALKWAVSEMEKRFQTLQENEVQNIEQYNKLEDVVKRRVPKMPYLVIVVDELAELMGNPQFGKDFDHNIQRITQLGRACGIHMVMATQRPSVNVITGTIKNNCPTRVSFKVKSFIDSKTILDEPGAENLLGAGDMLFAPQDSNAIIRLQAAFCNNDEIRNALKYVKENNEAIYSDEIQNEVYKKEEPVEEDGGEDFGGNGMRDNGMDSLMQQAVDFARSTGKISASVLQRRFRIGYNRAASIVDKMIEFGWVGPSNGSKPRDFNISEEQYRDLFGSDDDDSLI